MPPVEEPNDAITQPKPGQFGVIATRDPGGWLIRLGTRSSVNHACLSLGGDMIAEAVTPKVRVRQLGPDERWQWSDVSLTGTQRQAITNYGRDAEGWRYGWLDVLCCFLAVVGLRIRPVLNRIHDPKTTDCSHLVTGAYKAAGIDLVPGKPEYLETPGDLLDEIEHKTAPEWW